MELKKAFIFGFGKFSDFSLDFRSGLDCRIQENGWGKTTLTVFLKSMFYGMEDWKSKDVDKNERLKYLPWQGGKYGGNLEFSHNGKEYRITRSFGEKANSDTFELLDLKTNKEIILGGKILGNELFGINRDTFGRTVLVTLDNAPENSPDLSAKLNNLVEAGDISSYDKAIEKLNDKAKLLKVGKDRGLISNLQREIDSCRNSLSEIDAKLLQNEQYEKRISSIRESVDVLKKDQNKITEQLSQSAKYEGKLRYEQMKKDAAEAEAVQKSLLDFFNGQIPGQETLSKIDEIAGNYTTLDSNVKTQGLTLSERNQYEELKKSFGGDIPEKAQIENCLKIDNQYKKFQQEESEKRLTEEEGKEFGLLKQRFAGSDLSEQVIASKLSEISEIQNLKNEKVKLEAEQLSLNTKLELEQKSGKLNPMKIAFAVLGFAAAGAGGAAIILKSGIVFVCAAFGFMLLFTVLAVLCKNGKKDFSDLEQAASEIIQKIQNLEKLAEEKEKDCINFINKFSSNAQTSSGEVRPENEIPLINKISIDFNRYSNLQNKSSLYFKWLQTQPKVSCDYENELKAFVSRFCKTNDISAVSGLIQNLNDRLAKLQELEGRVDFDSKNNQLFSETKEKLVQILSQYKTDKTLDFAAQVQQLHNKINDMNNNSALLENLNSRLAEFERDPQNDVKAFENLEKPEYSADELRQKHSEISEEINSKNSEIAGYNRIIEANLAYTDKRAEIENDIVRMTEEKQEKTEEHKILTAAKKFLEQAKEKLDANYIDPMKEGFSKYMNMMAAIESENNSKNAQKFFIDTDLNVTVEKDGIRHDSKYLSAGYKDIINFCSRMALIDALFKDVKPPVILDDPFVNLDDEKVEHALKLLKKMAEEKQILYFACNNSRKVQ